MPIPRPRLTVRRLMIVVAVVTVLLGAAYKFAECNLLARFYRVEAQYHADRESALREIAAKDGGESLINFTPRTDTRSKRFPIRVMADFEAKLKRKYDRAASRPWLPVPPDPPEPE